jgi:hypothetical protein
MDVQKDFADLCSLLNAQGVEYLIVGGYAVAYHGAPRFTGDLDILVRPDAQQVERMLAAIGQFATRAWLGRKRGRRGARDLTKRSPSFLSGGKR